MKNSIYIITIVFVSVLIFSNCDINEPLNLEPKDEISEDAIWEDAALTESFVNDIYLGMGHGFWWHTMLSSISDETMFTHDQETSKIVQSTISSSDIVD